MQRQSCTGTGFSRHKNLCCTVITVQNSLEETHVKCSIFAFSCATAAGCSAAGVAWRASGVPSGKAIRLFEGTLAAKGLIRSASWVQTPKATCEASATPAMPAQQNDSHCRQAPTRALAVLVHHA